MTIRRQPVLANPARTVHINAHRGHAALCAALGIGEHHVATRDVYGGWYLTPDEHALLLAEYERMAPEREEAAREARARAKERYNARMRAPASQKVDATCGVAHGGQADGFTPPHDAERKSIASYRMLVAEAIQAGDRLTRRDALYLWHRARAFYGLSPTDDIPEIEVTASRSEWVAEHARRRTDSEFGRSETERVRAERSRRDGRAATRTPSASTAGAGCRR